VSDGLGLPIGESGIGVLVEKMEFLEIGWMGINTLLLQFRKPREKPELAG